jgi:hypothetical protein
MSSGTVGNVVIITLDAEVKDEILQVLLDIVYDTLSPTLDYNKELLFHGIEYLEHAIEVEGKELP